MEQELFRIFPIRTLTVSFSFLRAGSSKDVSVLSALDVFRV